MKKLAVDYISLFYVLKIYKGNARKTPPKLHITKKLKCRAAGQVPDTVKEVLSIGHGAVGGGFQ